MRQRRAQGGRAWHRRGLPHPAAVGRLPSPEGLVITHIFLGKVGEPMTVGDSTSCRKTWLMPSGAKVIGGKKPPDGGNYGHLHELLGNGAHERCGL